MYNKVENEFYETLKQKEANVSIYLINGVQLKGQIVDYDNEVAVLKLGEGIQVVYKSAISTIVPLPNDTKVEVPKYKKKTYNYSKFDKLS